MMATYPRNPRTHVPPTAVRGGARVYAKEKAEVIATVARTLTERSAPPLDARLKSILATQVGHLLKGGYPVDLIRSEAVTLCYENPQKLANIGGYVRSAYQKQIEAESKRVKAEEARGPIDPAVAAAIRGAIASRLRRAPDTGDIECVVCRQLTAGRCACGVALHPKACRLRHTCEVAA